VKGDEVEPRPASARFALKRASQKRRRYAILHQWYDMSLRPK